MELFLSICKGLWYTHITIYDVFMSDLYILNKKEWWLCLAIKVDKKSIPDFI